MESATLEAIGDVLLQPASISRLAYVRCDAFEVMEGESTLNLRERLLLGGAMRLITGLLKNNRDVQELDLGATGLQVEWAALLLQTLECNPVLTSIHLPYNPAIDESGQAALVGALEAHRLKITLHF